MEYYFTRKENNYLGKALKSFEYDFERDPEIWKKMRTVL